MPGGATSAVLGGPHQLLRPSDLVRDLVGGASRRLRQPRSFLQLFGAQCHDSEHHRLTRLGGESGAAGERPMRVQQGAAMSAGQVLALARREALSGDACCLDVIHGGGEPSARVLQAVAYRPRRHALQQLVVTVHGPAEAVTRAAPNPVSERIGA